MLENQQVEGGPAKWDLKTWWNRHLRKLCKARHFNSRCAWEVWGIWRESAPHLAWGESVGHRFISPFSFFVWHWGKEFGWAETLALHEQVRVRNGRVDHLVHPSSLAMNLFLTMILFWLKSSSGKERHRPGSSLRLPCQPSPDSRKILLWFRKCLFC